MRWLFSWLIIRFVRRYQKIGLQTAFLSAQDPQAKLNRKKEAVQSGYRNPVILSWSCIFENWTCKIPFLNPFSLGHAQGNREAWTCEPDGHPFCLSSLFSSLSSLKVRRLRWRNKTLMVGHLWNARTNKTTQKNPHSNSLAALQPNVCKVSEIQRSGFLLWTKQCRCSERVQSECRATAPQSRSQIQDVITLLQEPRSKHWNCDGAQIDFLGAQQRFLIWICSQLS